MQREDLPQPLAYGSAAFTTNLPASASLTVQVGPASSVPGPGVIWFGGRTSAGTAVSATYGYEPKLGTEEKLYAGSGRTLTHVDSRALTTTISSTVNSVTSTTILEFTALRTPSNPLPSGLSSAGHTFALAALTYPTGTVMSGFQFDDAVTATIYYDAADVLGMDENELVLLHWNGGQWVDAATTGAPASTYVRYPAENRVALPICRVGELALAAERTVSSIFLPVIYR
ncbi:MAG: hypothetical protein HY675_18050 [Chloroflexi bacterium]|nr:hypothetical protein [Chloroflexota bacterium]